MKIKSELTLLSARLFEKEEQWVLRAAYNADMINVSIGRDGDGNYRVLSVTAMGVSVTVCPSNIQEVFAMRLATIEDRLVLVRGC